MSFRHRSPLVGYFKHRGTDIEFIVVLNHLARGNAELWQQQAKGLRIWCEDQVLPVIGFGDYNFDFDFNTRRAVFTPPSRWTSREVQLLVLR